MVSRDLQKVKRAAARAAVSREALKAAIREARAQGASLRDVAKAAGMSYETVRRIAQDAEWLARQA